MVLYDSFGNQIKTESKGATIQAQFTPTLPSTVTYLQDGEYEVTDFLIQHQIISFIHYKKKVSYVAFSAQSYNLLVTLNGEQINNANWTITITPGNVNGSQCTATNVPSSGNDACFD